MSNKSFWWFLGCLLPLVLTAVSWSLGGNEVWGWVAGISTVLLVLCGVSLLRLLHELPPRAYLFLGYIALNWACWVAPGYYFPIITLKVDPASEEPNSSTRIEYNGTLLATLDRMENYSFQIRGQLQPRALRIETLGPRGWVKRPFRDYSYSVSLETVPTTTLYIDNRGHEAAKLQCGELDYEVPANTAEQRVFPAVPDDPVSVRLDVKEVGVLNGSYLLIDVLGSRRYRLRELVYSGGLNRALRALDAFDPNANPRPDLEDFRPDITYDKGHVHKLPNKVDYFLQKAPEKITVTTLAGFAPDETRHELLEEKEE